KPRAVGGQGDRLDRLVPQGQGHRSRDGDRPRPESGKGERPDVRPFREHRVGETRAVRRDTDAAGAEPGREPHWGPAGPTRAGQGDLVDVWAAVAGRDAGPPESAGRP